MCKRLGPVLVRRSKYPLLLLLLLTLLLLLLLKQVSIILIKVMKVLGSAAFC